MVDKATVLEVIRAHGLALKCPACCRPSTIDAALAAFDPADRLVIRTSCPSGSDRNLPRAIDLTKEEARVWSQGVDEALEVLIDEYTRVIATAEVLVTSQAVVIELVFGLWELDNVQHPQVARAVRPEEGGGVVWTNLTTAVPELPRRFAYETGLSDWGHPPGWLMHALREWVQTNLTGLDGLCVTLGGPQIVKCHVSEERGIEAQNARSAQGSEYVIEDLAHRPTPSELPIVSSVHQDIEQQSAVILNVSLIREDAHLLSAVIPRLVAAGVTVVYIHSGLLSHLAITLREAGLEVRRAWYNEET